MRTSYSVLTVNIIDTIIDTNKVRLTLVYLMSKYSLFSVDSNKLQHDGLVKGSGNLIGSPSSPNQWLKTKTKNNYKLMTSQYYLYLYRFLQLVSFKKSLLKFI